MTITAQFVSLLAWATVWAKVVVARLWATTIVEWAFVDVHTATVKVLLKTLFALTEERTTSVYAETGVVRAVVLVRLFALVDVWKLKNKNGYFLR